jgi:hypothetical protein
MWPPNSTRLSEYSSSVAVQRSVVGGDKNTAGASWHDVLLHLFLGFHSPAIQYYNAQ